MRMNPLPYRVVCYSPTTPPIFEIIATFNIVEAAINYASTCAQGKPAAWEYRVMLRGKRIFVVNGSVRLAGFTG